MATRNQWPPQWILLDGVCDESRGGELSAIPGPYEWAHAAGITGGGFLEPIDTPLVFRVSLPRPSGNITADWAQYGMVSRQAAYRAQPDDAKILPGDMVGMVLVQGDLSLDAACT